MGSSSLTRVATAVGDATAVCNIHQAMLWSSNDYAQKVREESVHSTAAPDPRWSWPTSEELGRCVVALFGDASAVSGRTSEDVPVLVDQMKHPDPCLRLDAVSKLGALEAGAAEAAAELGAKAADRGELPNIRLAAMEAGSRIWGILAHGAAKLIAKVMWDPLEDMRLRRSAIGAFAAIGTCATTNALEDFVLDEKNDDGLRLEALNAIEISASNNSSEVLGEIRDLMGARVVELAVAGGPGINAACDLYEFAKQAAVAADDEGAE